MKYAFGLAAAALFASGIALAQTSAPAPAAPTVAAPASSCAAFPAAPQLPQGELQTSQAKAITAATEAMNLWIDATNQVKTCRQAELQGRIEKTNALVEYANAYNRAARAAVAAAAEVPAVPATAPESACAAFPVMADLPPAAKIAERNVWVTALNTSFECRKKEIADQRAANQAYSTETATAMTAAGAVITDWSARVTALNEKVAAKNKGKRKN